MIVYKISHKESGKSYIGVTRQSVRKRWYDHIYCALVEKRKSAFWAAIRKYGPDMFETHILYEAVNERELMSVESALISVHNTFTPNGYNLTTGGYNVLGRKPSRSKFTEEMIAYIRNPILAHLTNKQMLKLVNDKFDNKIAHKNTVDLARTGIKYAELNMKYPPIRVGKNGRQFRKQQDGVKN